jgi:hypothetical protein
MGDQSLYPSEMSDATVLFRNGKEVVQGEAAKSSRLNPEAHVVDTVGTFGAVLNTVLVGAMSPGSDLQWSRWDRYDWSAGGVPLPSSAGITGFCGRIRLPGIR